jgi:hypothetical protein
MSGALGRLPVAGHRFGLRRTFLARRQTGGPRAPLDDAVVGTALLRAAPPVLTVAAPPVLTVAALADRTAAALADRTAAARGLRLAAHLVEERAAVAQAGRTVLRPVRRKARETTRTLSSEAAVCRSIMCPNELVLYAVRKPPNVILYESCSRPMANAQSMKQASAQGAGHTYVTRTRVGIVP